MGEGVHFSGTVFVDPSKVTSGDAIIKMAAKSMMTDIETRSSFYHQSENETESTKIKDKVISLSLKHNITSKYTSFIAVEKRTVPTLSTMKIVMLSEQAEQVI